MYVALFKGGKKHGFFPSIIYSHTLAFFFLPFIRTNSRCNFRQSLKCHRGRTSQETTPA